jgi:hypothetical protein
MPALAAELDLSADLTSRPPVGPFDFSNPQKLTGRGLEAGVGGVVPGVPLAVGGLGSIDVLLWMCCGFVLRG